MAGKKALFSLCSVIPVFLILLSFPLQCAAAEEKHEHHHDHHAPAVPQPVVDMEVSPAELKAGIPATISFTIKSDDGKPVQDLTISHERLLHIIIVSKDFSIFAHIHPEDFGGVTGEMKKRAVFPVRFTFPKAGHYLVAADYAVKGVNFSKHFDVEVKGKPRMGGINKDFSLNRKFGEYEVSLGTEPRRIEAKEKALLTYTIKKNGVPVKNIEPYLGAPMHLAIIRADLNQFIHAHADRPGNASHPAGHVHATSDEPYGPELEAQVVFPVEGVYKLFSQVKHEGKVQLFEFLVKVH